MKWLLGIALRFLDSTIQRVIAPGNRLQTVGGVAGGTAILAAMNYLETQMHCDLSEFKLAALIPIIQGAGATGNGVAVPKVLAAGVRTAGDDAHDQAGQG